MKRGLSIILICLIYVVLGFVSRALPLVRSSLRSLQASFAALSSEDGDLPENKIYIHITGDR